MERSLRISHFCDLAAENAVDSHRAPFAKAAESAIYVYRVAFSAKSFLSPVKQKDQHTENDKRGHGHHTHAQLGPACFVWPKAY